MAKLQAGRIAFYTCRVDGFLHCFTMIRRGVGLALDVADRCAKIEKTFLISLGEVVTDDNDKFKICLRLCSDRGEHDRFKVSKPFFHALLAVKKC